MKKKIMLIDGNSIINRAFYAIPVLTNADNEYTNGVYGFLNIFFKLFDEENPDYVAVAFDVHAPTFRHKKYDSYKGTRKSMPEELRPQIPLLKNVLHKMNIKVFELAGYEADDVIGTLALSAENAGLHPVIVSGDRDMLQLATENILVRIPKTKGGKTEVENYYESDVIRVIGVTPKEYIEVKALMGDASDNIPGVPGIGEKTAVKIISEYKDIENAISHSGDIKPKKASENLGIYQEQARLSRELAEIFLQVPLQIEFEDMQSGNMYNGEALAEIQRLEFKSMITRFTVADNNRRDYSYTALRDKDSLTKLLEGFNGQNVVGFDIVSTQGEFVGVSICTGDGMAYAVMPGVGFLEKDIIDTCRLLLMGECKKITLDSKKIMVYLHKHGVEINNIAFDCMLAGYILNASKSSYNYEDIALEFLGETRLSLEEITGKGRNKLKLSEIPAGKLEGYIAGQADVAYLAYPVMEEKMKAEGQDALYYDIELPLAEVLKDMEVAGIRVDAKALAEFGVSLNGVIERLTTEIYAMAGEEFNINSPSQLGVILFEKLMLRGGKKTKTGYSTNADVLGKLVGDHPIVEKIQEYRTYTKLKSTYVDGLLSVIDPTTGRIYSTFNQTITTTGRISSTEPNLQNVPIRLPLGRSLRKVFIPEDDSYVFMDGDYSQIELRVLAHMADDETLIRAFREGLDIHRLTASQVFNTPFDEVTAEQRSNAKAVNFGIVYGIGGFSLSEDLKITKKEADRYIQGYFVKYPQVRAYLDYAVSSARKNGYAVTIFNRRRKIPEINASNFYERAFGERAAMNMPVQGSAADIIKIAMVKVSRRLKKEGLTSRLILQVHDELLLEVKKDERERVRTLLKEEMENAVALKVPLETDFHEGSTWYDTK